MEGEERECANNQQYNNVMIITYHFQVNRVYVTRLDYKSTIKWIDYVVGRVNSNNDAHLAIRAKIFVRFRFEYHVEKRVLF